MFTYVREILFADRFGGSDDPARWAAVARFLTDCHERVANAGCSQYCALANSLRGVERLLVESTPSLDPSANEPGSSSFLAFAPRVSQNHKAEPRPLGSALWSIFCSESLGARPSPVPHILGKLG